MIASSLGISIEQAKKEILQTLYRRGGELTSSELVLTTKMPYELIRRALIRLQNENKVQIGATPVTGLELVVLQ